MFDENKKLALCAKLKTAKELVEEDVETLREAERKNAEAKRKSEHVPLTRLMRRLEKHKEELTRVSEQYRIYDYDNYTYVTERVAQVRPHVKSFPERLQDVSALAKTRQWFPWPEEVSHVQYVSSEDGVGNGERRVATLFGGLVSGPSVNHDVTLSDGSKWEVKQVLKKSDLIRVAASGQRALSDFKQQIDDVLCRLNRFVCALHGLDTGSDARLSYIERFVSEEFDNIVRYGELHTSRFCKLKKAMHVASSILSDASERVAAISGYELVHGDDRVAIDDDEARRLLATIAETGSVSVCHLDAYALFVSKHLCCPAFQDPQRYCHTLADMLRAHNAFEHVNGLVLVNSRGLRVIDREELDDVLDAWAISQGRLRYKFKGDVL